MTRESEQQQGRADEAEAEKAKTETEAPRSKSAARRARRKKAVARRERSGALIDSDERLWRSLSGGGGGIPSYTHSRMQRLAYELWLTNLMGQRLIEVVTDHVVGEGVAWQSEEKSALEAVRAFWRDPVNQLDLRFERLVSELGIFG